MDVVDCGGVENIEDKLFRITEMWFLCSF